LPRSRRRPAPKRFRNPNIFINVPFDRRYESCYLALIAGLVAAGLKPASVLEYPADQPRLRLLFRRLQECAASIHDLSRQVGRFNMPFEAGLAKALQLSGRNHAVFFLESQRFRLSRTLSDAGQDAYIHHGRPFGVLRAVGSIFGPRDGALPFRALRRVYTRFVRRAVPTVRSEWGTLYDRRPFAELLFAARQIARDLDLP
jgi:hypothetical protein